MSIEMNFICFLFISSLTMNWHYQLNINRSKVFHYLFFFDR
jgi:hypothetical protein